ncbi:TPA: 50S ribosomal protein L6 [bacterium]|nr:50S ribosomal protein L6 [bacterium]
MSRVGCSPIQVPEGVKVEIKEGEVVVEGPKGKSVRSIPSGINIEVAGDKIFVTKSEETRSSRAFHGLTRSLINNMVIGVTQGFTKVLGISGVGYRAALSGDKITIQLGYSHPVTFEPPEGIQFELPDPTHIKVLGIDKELVGRVAEKIRSFRPPDPYKAKGIKYEGEHIRRKAGKTA